MSDVVVYGANGATGSRFAAIAVAAGRRPVLAGRNERALHEVADPLGLDVRVAPLDRLDAAFEGASVVVSCVTSYTTFGIPVVEAALRGGAHHVDCTGEPRFVHRLLTEYDARARRAGVAIVPAAGIGTVSNLTARAAAAGLDEVERLTVDYRVRRMIPSEGTTRSTLMILAGGAPVAHDGEVEWGASGRLIGALPGGAGALFPLTDVVTFGRLWPEARIESYVRSRVARPLAVSLRAGQVLGRSARFRDLAGGAVGRLGGAKPRGRFTVTVAAAGGGRERMAVTAVPDIYEVTSQAANELTRILVEVGAEPGFRATGELIGEPRDVARRINVTLTAP